MDRNTKLVDMYLIGFIVSLMITIRFVKASEFDCDGTTKQCICTKQSCDHICTDYNQCQNYQFNCFNHSHSCSVVCLHHNSCKNTKFYFESSNSRLKCHDIASCKNILFECKSINDCILESNELSFLQSQYICNGIDTYTNECHIEIIGSNSTVYGMLTCLLNNSNDTIGCTIDNNKLSCLPSNKCSTQNNNNCIGVLCNKDSNLFQLPNISIEINDSEYIYNSGNSGRNNNNECNNNIWSDDMNIWILTIIVIILLSISCISFYYCSSLCGHDKRDGQSSKKGAVEEDEKGRRDVMEDRKKDSKNNIEIKRNNKTESDTEPETTIEKRGESGVVKVFESSFWLTILSTLFNDDDKSDGIDCGIILIPNGMDCSIVLNKLECIQCKVPVTEQFLKHYGKTSTKPNSYILIQNGYIYAYEIYNNKNNLLYNTYQLIIIDSQKKTTQKHSNSYYRIFVNNLRVKSADQFCSVLMNQHGMDINLKTDDTTSLQLRESLELSNSFFETKAEGMAATNLANSLHYLQEKRNHRTNAEMVGATIVVIPYNKTLADYKLYLRQYLAVSIEVSDSALLCIFSHNSVLHDGAIFVRGNTIIAVKAFFRITGQYKNKVSIGHGTRHASAQEFSKHSKIHNPITFVLSEEDGQIRSCIAGEIKKINYRFIARLVVQRHHTSKINEGKTITINNNNNKKTKKKTKKKTEKKINSNETIINIDQNTNQSTHSSV